MEEIGNAVKTVCIVSGAICIIECMVSGTRFRNQIKLILSLIFVIVLISPIIRGNFDTDIIDIESYFNIDYSESEDKYIEELKKQTEANISEVLMEQIRASGIKCEEIKVSVNISEANSISINSITVSADNYEDAAEVIRSSLGAETEVRNGNN